MCGICGFVDPSGRLGQDELRRMNATIVRRGPDEQGELLEGPVGLAMRRLSILDLAGSQQPLHNEDGLISLVYNGEIYNYRELRALLLERGHTLRTQGDSEVLVHLYEEYGQEMLQHLRGMFAFALWDRRDQSLLIARDRLGIKPLYWAQHEGTLLFGSEIKALLAAQILPREIDWQAIDAFLTYTYIPAPLSAYRTVHKLPAGHLLHFRDGEPRVRRWWNPDFSRQERLSEADWEERIAAKLADAVQSHLVSDVPLGAFLSGGIDSSLVVALMSEASAEPVQCFTMGFGGADLDLRDERPYARLLAQRYGAQMHEFEVKPDLSAILDEILDAFDEPFADDSVVPSYYISMLTRQKVKVALSGLGGDELFGGYHRYRGFLLSSSYDAVPNWLHKGAILPLVERIPEPRGGADRIDHLKRFARGAALAPAERYLGYVSSLDAPARARLYAPELHRRIDFEATGRHITQPFNECGSDDLLDRVFYTDLKTYLPEDILALSDRLSMWHSLELRVPLIDHELTELTLRMPSQHKVRRNELKRMLKRVAAAKLPAEILQHRKQGFESPMAAWLRGELREFARSILLDSSVDRLGLFERAEIERLFTAHQDGRQKNNKILFSLLMLFAWMRRNGLD